MRSHRALSVTSSAALALLTGVADAQAPAAPQASAALARQVELAPAEQRAQAEAFVSRMDSSRYRVRKSLEVARSERDIVKTLCLNDKLNQIDVAIRSARERREALEQATSRGDAELSGHELTLLTVLANRAAALTVEANECVGNPGPAPDDSSVDPKIDDDLPAEDPSEYPPTDAIVEPPACSSCFK